MTPSASTPMRSARLAILARNASSSRASSAATRALSRRNLRCNFSEVSRILTCLSRAMDARHSASAALALARCNAATSRRSSRSAPRMASADACSSSIASFFFPRRVEAHLDASSDRLAVGKLRLCVRLLTPRDAVRPALLLGDASLLANEGVGVSLQPGSRDFLSRQLSRRSFVGRSLLRLRGVERGSTRGPFPTVTDRYRRRRRRPVGVGGRSTAGAARSSPRRRRDRSSRRFAHSAHTTRRRTAAG
mmetsp:Transcript_13649/g.53835  ORF Transcript_13649/g.53835 Transcript_13649/m.53835 type:complete len:249 (+) Transcript_13649:2524-3270(+)